MNLIMGQIEPEHPELLALEFGKIAESDFVYTLASRNVNQSECSMSYCDHSPSVGVCRSVRRPSVLCFLVNTLQILTNQHQTWSKCM